MRLLKMDGITGLFHSVILLIAFAAQNEERYQKCAYHEHYHQVDEQSVAGDNTILCSKSSRCFGLWEKKHDGKIRLIKQGCWTYIGDQQVCHDRCVVTMSSQIQNITYRFCCCSTNMCNVNFTENWVPSPNKISPLAFSEGHVVKVPAGPLVHVEGQAISIRCNVSDYQGPREQDFDWSMIQADDKPLRLISTFDVNFTDPTVRDRVNNGDINFKRLGDDSVELRFKKVRATDSGVYRCSTSSTDSVISGNYQADVELKVIGDSLKVSPAIPKSAVSEGESLELQCKATRGFTEHTFLSVGWSVKKGSGLLDEILTFGPDDKIKVGSNYTQRYTDGGLRLDLRGDGFYGLVLKSAKPSDQGEYVCSVQEWLRQGEGRNWGKIQEKSEEMGKVVVKPTGLHATNDKKTKGMMEEKEVNSNKENIFCIKI